MQLVVETACNIMILKHGTVLLTLQAMHTFLSCFTRLNCNTARAYHVQFKQRNNVAYGTVQIFWDMDGEDMF